MPNDTVGPITKANNKVTIFLSKLSENYRFLVKKPNTEIKILNYNLTIIEKIKLIFFLFTNKPNNVYILAPKNFYYYLPLILKKTKFYAICINGTKNYRRPNNKKIYF